MSTQLDTICGQALGATANAVYQGVAIVILAALGMHWLKRANAATRHAILFTLLLVVAALVPAHLAVAWKEGSSGKTVKQVFAPVAQEAVRPSLATLDTSAVDVESVGNSEPENQPEAGIDRLFTTSPVVDNVQEPKPLTKRANFFKSLLAKIPSEIRLPRFVPLALVGAWVLLSGIRGARILSRLAEIRRAKKFSAPPSPRVQRLFERLRAGLSLPRPVRLRLSVFHQTPMALGFVRPAVLIPAEMDRNSESDGGTEIEHVLRHELAHIERRDDWGNLVQQTIEAALFFHPGIWWISRRLSLEREIACDDEVLKASGHPRNYALTLANTASRMVCGQPILAPGVSGNSSQLQQRIDMILNTHRDRSSRLAKRWLGLFATAAATLAALAIVAGPRLVLAQTPPPPPNPAAPDLADGTPAALPGSSAVEAGPRSKPEDSDVVEAPEPPEPPEAPEPAEAPDVVASVAVNPVAMPKLALIDSDSADDADDAKDSGEGKPDRPHKDHRDTKDMSVEDRLDRIERILRQLQGRDGAKVLRLQGLTTGVAADVHVQPKIAFNNDWTAAQAKMAAEQARMAADQGRRAADEAKRAAEQAMRDIAREQGKMGLQMQKDQADGLKMQLEGLRQARESLQGELHSLEGQIKELEQKRDHLKDEKDGKGDSGDSSSQ